MDDVWYNIGCDALCSAIENCVGTDMYTIPIQALSITGVAFFAQTDPKEWILFFDLIGMKSFTHIVLMKKWVSTCISKQQIVTQAPMLGPVDVKHAPKVQHRSAATLSLDDMNDRFDIEEDHTFSTPATATTVHSPGDSLPECSGKGFFPTQTEVFKDSGGRSILKTSHPEAHKIHLRNFRIVRAWFETFATDPQIYAWLDADFKSNTIIKEECRRYVHSRMKELLPLRFVCPQTGAKHEMPWPEDFVFEAVLHRKHEWKKAKKSSGEDRSSGRKKSESKISKNLGTMKVAMEKEEVEALELCQNTEKYALDLYAYEMKQGLGNLKLRENMAKESINDQCQNLARKGKPLAFHGASIFGRGTPISIHVLDSIRCWKIKYISTRFLKPSGTKRLKKFWVPLMKPLKGTATIDEVQVEEINPGMEVYIPRTHCSLSPLPPQLERSDDSDQSLDGEDLFGVPLSTEKLKPKDEENRVEEAMSNAHGCNSKIDTVAKTPCGTSIILEDDQSGTEINVNVHDSNGVDLKVVLQGDSAGDTETPSVSSEEETDMCASDTEEEHEIKRRKVKDESTQEPHGSAEFKETLLSKVEYARKVIGSTAPKMSCEISKVLHTVKLLQKRVVLQSLYEDNKPSSVRERRSIAAYNGKENKLSFNAISTPVEINARGQLLSGNKKATQVETLPGTGDKRGRNSLADPLGKIDWNILSYESKEVVCMKAMGLMDITEVQSAVKGFISEMNVKAGENKPFKGHRKKDIAELVDMVAMWCIQTQFVILRDIPPVRLQDNIQRLWPECVIKSLITQADTK